MQRVGRRLERGAPTGLGQERRGVHLVGTDVVIVSSNEHVYARILERANAPIFGVDHLGEHLEQKDRGNHAVPCG